MAEVKSFPDLKEKIEQLGHSVKEFEEVWFLLKRIAPQRILFLNQTEIEVPTILAHSFPPHALVSIVADPLTPVSEIRNWRHALPGHVYALVHLNSVSLKKVWDSPLLPDLTIWDGRGTSQFEKHERQWKVSDYIVAFAEGRFVLTVNM